MENAGFLHCPDSEFERGRGNAQRHALDRHRDAHTHPQRQLLRYSLPHSGELDSGEFQRNGWQNATLYTAAQVTNQAAYTNYASTAWPNAKFIWSSNLILDNVFLTRKTVGTVAVSEAETARDFHFQNPFSNKIAFQSGQNTEDATAILFDAVGRQMAKWTGISAIADEKIALDLPGFLPDGICFLKMESSKRSFSVKLFHVNLSYTFYLFLKSGKDVVHKVVKKT